MASIIAGPPAEEISAEAKLHLWLQPVIVEEFV